MVLYLRSVSTSGPYASPAQYAVKHSAPTLSEKFNTYRFADYLFFFATAFLLASASGLKSRQSCTQWTRSASAAKPCGDT